MKCCWPPTPTSASRCWESARPRCVGVGRRVVVLRRWSALKHARTPAPAGRCLSAVMLAAPLILHNTAPHQLQLCSKFAQRRARRHTAPHPDGCLEYPDCPAACTSHPDTLPPASLQELTSILAAIPYNDNDVYLHTDEALMPRCKKTWASWNFLGRSSDEGHKCAVCLCASCCCA